MDTLRDKLKQQKPSQTLKTASGGLAQASTEELAAQTKLPAQPITPVGGAGIGANPDQAKMMGASAQKASALRASLQGGEDLQTRLRQEQARTQQTSAEKAEVAKSQAAQPLGDLQSRVQQIVDSKLQAGAQAAGKTLNTANLNTSNISDPETKALLDKLKASPNDQAVIAQLSNKLHPGENKVITQDDLNALVGSSNAAVGQQVASATADTIKAADLPVDVQESVRKFIPDADIANMTLEDLQREIQSEIDTEMQQVSKEEAKLADPYIGAAERAEARKNLRDMGATGVAAAESEAEKLADKIVNADTIKFNGQDVQVKDLLADDHIAGLVANYLADPNSEASKQLIANEPELVGLVKQFEPLMKEAVKGLGTGITEAGKISEANKALQTVDLGGGLQGKFSDEVMKALDPTFGTVTGTKSIAAGSPLLGVMKNVAIPAADRKSFIDLINSHPEFVSELNKMSPQDLYRAATGEGRKTLENNLEYRGELSRLDSKSPDLNAASAVLGYKDFQDMRNNVQNMISVAGQQGNRDKVIADLQRKGLSFIVGQGGQVTLDMAQTVSNLKKQAGTNVLSALNYKAPNEALAAMGEQAGKAPALVQRAAKAAPDGVIDTQLELDRMFQPDMKNLGTTFTEMKDFMQTQAYAQMPPSIRQAMQTKANDLAAADEKRYLESKFGIKASNLDSAIKQLAKLPATLDNANKLREAIKTAESDAKNNPIVAAQYGKTIRDQLAKIESDIRSKAEKDIAAKVNKSAGPGNTSTGKVNVGTNDVLWHDLSAAEKKKIEQDKVAREKLMPKDSGMGFTR